MGRRDSSWLPPAGQLGVFLVFGTVPLAAQSGDRIPFVPPTILAALGVPPSVAAAQSRLAQALARRAAAGEPGTWSLSAETSEVPRGDFGAGNIRVDLSREILPAGRRTAEAAVAEAELKYAAVILDGARLRAVSVLVRTAAGAVGWELIRRRRAAQDSLLATAEEALRSRFDAGQARYLDVLRLRTERLRVTAALAEAQAEADAAAATLLQLAGDADGRTRLRRALALARSAPESLGPLPAVPDPDSLVEVSIALALARAEEDRSRAERRRELADRHTQGSAFAGLQRIGGAENGAVFGPTLGVTLSLPFLTSGATQRRRAAADSTVAAAEMRTSSIKAVTTSLLSAAAARFAGTRRRAALLDAALLRGALEERDVALASYLSGTLSLLELLDFEQALAEAEIGRTENLILAADSWADLLEVQAGEPSTTMPE